MHRFSKMAAAWIVLVLIVASAPADAQQRPPEYGEFMEAIRIEDLNARIEELERIKAAYPESQMASAFDNAILMARIGLCTDVDTVLELQKTRFQTDDVFGRIVLLYISAMDIVRHDNIALFDKAAVTRAVLDYAGALRKLAKDGKALKSFTDVQVVQAEVYAANINLPVALAHLNEGDPEKAESALDAYLESGGVKDKNYHYISARVFEGLDRIVGAYEAYLEAAVENLLDSAERARALHERLFGDATGFAELLENRQRALPYRVEPFRLETDWTGKTVLAELFTGSECPPCVAADLGFDGLLEAFEPKYLSVLQYHLPIPGPDPMQNHATDLRARFYGVNSTPMTFFDGQRKHGGGGGRAQAEGKHAQYAGEVASLIAGKPPVKLRVSAQLDGDTVVVDFSVDGTAPGADFHLALAQKEEKYLGGNGIMFHKMVVREFLTLDEAAVLAGKARIDLKAAEAAAEKHLSEFEAERRFTFPVKKTTIDRDALQVVIIAQDRNTKNVHNAAAADISK